jgi:hypothetical protein
MIELVACFDGTSYRWFDLVEFSVASVCAEFDITPSLKTVFELDDEGDEYRVEVMWAPKLIIIVMENANGSHITVTGDASRYIRDAIFHPQSIHPL